MRSAPLTPQKIEQQARDGVFLLSFALDPIPLLHCVLPIKQAMKQLARYEPQLRGLTDPQLLNALVGEFTEANQQQDQTIVQSSCLLALCSILRAFGNDARSLFDMVHRHRQNLGLMVTRTNGCFAFGIGTGISNVAMAMIGKPNDQQKYPAPEMPASAWRTKVDPAATASYGVPELHAAMFQPIKDRGGPNHTVDVMVPETHQSQIRLALNIATKVQARMLFLCDTAEQAEAMADYAAPLLPHHRRIAYERAEAGKWGALA